MKNFLLIVILGLAIYANILNAPFQYDDLNFIVDNPLVKDAGYLLEHWRDSAVDQRKILSFLTFAFNYWLGGNNPFVYHLTNVFLHILNVILLYAIILKLNQEKYFALCASLVFLVHPLQTQAVTYIWQRTEVLSGMFYLLSYWLYLRARLEKRPVFFAAAGLIFYIGFFAKGTIVSLPLLILATELIFFEHSAAKKMRLAYVAFAFIAAVLLLWQLQFLNFILEKFHLPFLLNHLTPYLDFPYLLTQLKVWVFYAGMSFFPVNQNLDHDFTFSSSIFERPVILALFLLTAAFIGAVKLSAKDKTSALAALASLGIFWFYIYLIPTSIGFITLEPVQEHRLYLSMAGFALFLTGMIFRFIKNERARTACVVSIIAVLSVLTVARNFVWTSQERLAIDTVRKSPKKARPYFTLGAIYLQKAQFGKAEYLFKKTIELDPVFPDAYNNLGVVDLNIGLLSQAEQLFRKTLEVNPEYIYAYINLGEVASRRKDDAEAKGWLLKAIGLKEKYPRHYLPGVDKATVKLAGIYIRENNYAEGERYLKLALVLNPYNEKAYIGLGSIAVFQGNLDQALGFYQKAVKINPSLYEGYLQPGAVYVLKKDYPRAVEFYQKAIQIDPARPEANTQLEAVLKIEGAKAAVKN